MFDLERLQLPHQALKTHFEPPATQDARNRNEVQGIRDLWVEALKFSGDGFEGHSARQQTTTERVQLQHFIH